MHIDDSSTNFNYEMIIGRDLCKELVIVLHFAVGTMIWHNIAAPMKDLDAMMEELYYILDDAWCSGKDVETCGAGRNEYVANM